MVKTTWGGKIFYACGSYKRYGASVCSKHYIAHDVVAKVVLDDLNRLMAAVENLRQLAQQGVAQRPSSNGDPPQKLEAALQRIQRRRQSAYEDYQDALISKEDFLRYRADYDAQEQALQVQLDKLRGSVQDDPLSLPWVKELLASGQLAELDRPTVAAAIREIRVYEGNHMEIDYLLPEAAALCWRGECMVLRVGKSEKAESEEKFLRLNSKNLLHIWSISGILMIVRRRYHDQQAELYRGHRAFHRSTAGQDTGGHPPLR